MSTPSLPRRACIVTRVDEFANAIKPRELARLFAELGFEVDQVDTVGLGRRSARGWGRLLPSLGRTTVTLYVLEVLREFARLALSSRLAATYARLNSYLLPFILRLRGATLNELLIDRGFTVIICESGLDEGLFLRRRIADLQILDLPAPYADELFYGQAVTDGNLPMLRSTEVECYRAADRLSFHWHTYEEYVRQHFYSGPNFFDCSYGVRTKSRHAAYSSSPRIVFLGGLDSYWVNSALLLQLCQAHPNIDLWGGPDPGAAFAPYYRGYAESLDVLAGYQFGLVTVTDDPLRQSGFSSKHLEYLSYGLPVLTPSWRQDSVLDVSSVKYERETFSRVISEANSPRAWNVLSKKSLALAATLTWERALADLRRICEEGESA